MKNLLFTVLFVLTSTLSFCQNPKIKIGVQAGINYSDFRGYNIPIAFERVFKESPAFNFFGGLNFEYQFKENLSLRLEINYERKSQQSDNSLELRQSFSDPSVLYNYKSYKNYDYLVLPIMIKYNFTDKDSFYLNGGPFIGYLLKSKIVNDVVIPNFNTNDLDTTSNNKSTDFGLSIGLGKNFEINDKHAINIEIRENLGLTNTSKIDVWNGGTVQTNSINLIVGFSLN